MSLILGLGEMAVNRPQRGIFEQSALKIRANDCKSIVLGASESNADPILRDASLRDASRGEIGNSR
jgi:hypothetical protein